MNMKKITIVILFFLVANVFGQRKYTADLYFKEFAYVKSAELYQKIYQKGDSSKLVLERLGDSYYYNSNTNQSEVWYKKLFALYQNDNISLDYYFRYAQSLKSNGKYKESDSWLQKMNQLSKSDSRLESFNNNKGYLKDFTIKKPTFINLKNLSINSKYSDYGGYFNDSVFVFSSTRPKLNVSKSKLYQWNRQPFYNIYITDLVSFENENDILFVDGNITSLAKGMNSIYHDGSAIITKDGLTMYFTRDNYDGKRLRNDHNKVSHLKIFKAELLNGKWTNIAELPFNSDNYSIGNPALSLDEKTLYFNSDMPGGFGETDLYKVKVLENGSYGKPVNLGAKINTEAKEMFPFVEKDSILYFSSNGHIGLGGLDVFKAAIEENTFGKVENLGTPINSNKDDFSFSINRKKRIGFFSSNRKGGKGDDDIYSFILKKKEVVCNQFVNGIITDKFTKEVMPNSKVVLYENNVKKDSVIVGVDARFEFAIACNTSYKIVASKQYYQSSAKVFISAKITGKTTQDLSLNLMDDFQYSNGQIVVKINPIYFNYNKSDIRRDASLELNKVVAIMKKYPELIIESGSHTDARGRASYNEALSERRAISTVKYIVSKGINPARISGKGFGETKLVNDCVDNDSHSNRVKCTKEEHQLNRRTEFVVMNSKIVSSIKTPIFKKEIKTHKVVKGDTLFSIAKKYKIALEDLKKLNNIIGNQIFVGQLLKIK